jgi:GNAT superfamily N-acetyltransferase
MRSQRITKSALRRSSEQQNAEFQDSSVTAKNWCDLETLFGPKGACAGCWCMYWRLRRSVWEQHKGEKNRRALHTIMESGDPTGVLAYDGEKPVGWCAVAPRQDFVTLENSRILKPVDDQAVWSVPCFFVAKDYRRCGATAQLLQGAVEYAQKRGAKIVEGYPNDPKGQMADAFAWTGIASAFKKAEFVEVARRSKTRPIMRKSLVAGR